MSNSGTFSTATYNYASSLFTQFNLELSIDTAKNVLIIRLTDGKNIAHHPAFDEQADFFIHIQLLSNKMFEKVHNIRNKRRPSLKLSAWKKQPEKSTKSNIVS